MIPSRLCEKSNKFLNSLEAHSSSSLGYDAGFFDSSYGISSIFWVAAPLEQVKTEVQTMIIIQLSFTNDTHNSIIKTKVLCWLASSWALFHCQ